MHAPDLPLSQKQTGSALIVSMVLLLLLMLTAVAGISDSIVQERMAHNAKRLNDSFQMAETGLRYVELQVRAKSLELPTMVCQPRACEVPTAVLDTGTSGAPGQDWDRVPATVAGNDIQVWYRVVRLGDSAISLNLTPGAVSTLYRISVLSQRDSTRTLLEGVYAFTRT